MNPTRRDAIRAAIFGTGAVGLRSLASGLPAAAFAGGLWSTEALAAEVRDPQFLLMFTSQRGDPMNATTPGTYGAPGFVPNPQPEMRETQMSLGGTSTTGAAPWATLPQWVLDRTAFIHHRTYQNSHAQHESVLGLVGAARSATGSAPENVASVVASEVAPLLRTTQPEPVRLGGDRERVTFEGRLLQSIRPSTLADVLAPPGTDTLDLVAIRQRALDDMYNLAKEHGTPAHRTWIDQYASSRQQVAELDLSLVEVFDNINGNGQLEQVRAALALFMMRLTPVATVYIDFGGDNHNDTGLRRERDRTVSALETLNAFFEELDSSPLRDQVTVANLNVFGRTLTREDGDGRDHNLNHHVMMISGANVGAGVFGGLAPSGNDLGATGMDSVTGAGVEEGGDIPKEETLESAAKTLATVLGVSSESVENRILNGKVIEAAVG